MYGYAINVYYDKNNSKEHIQNDAINKGMHPKWLCETKTFTNHIASFKITILMENLNEINIK